MLQSRHLIAQTVIGQGRQVVPPGIPLSRIFQCVQRLPVAAKADVIQGCLLVVVTGVSIRIAALLIAAEAEGVILAIAAVAAGRTGLGRILDLLIGSIDLLHLFGRFRVTGIPVRVVFFGQSPVGPFDFLIGSTGADAQNLIRILDHTSSLALAPRPRKLDQTPLYKILSRSCLS